MSCKVMYTCDHCNTHCSGEQYASIGRWDESGIIALGKTVHGCSKEHLGIALAKMFGIGINGETDELLNRKRRELTKLTDANNFLVTERDNMRARLAELEARMPANEVTNAERMQYETTIELQQKRIAELEKRIAELTEPMTVDGKTPGQVFAQISSQVPLSLPLEKAREIIATNLLRAFGQPRQTTQDAADALRRVRDRIDYGPTENWRGDMRRIIDDELAKLSAEPTQAQKRFKYERAWLSEQTDDTLFDLYMEHVKFFDMNGTMLERANMLETLAAIEQEQAITLPTKPTKPLRERLEELAAYWYVGDKDDKELNGAYRLARQECAKELREVINDPR